MAIRGIIIVCMLTTLLTMAAYDTIVRPCLASQLFNNSRSLMGGGGTVVADTVELGDWTISESGGNLVFAKGGVTQATLSDDGLQVENLGVNVAPANNGYVGFIASQRDGSWSYGDGPYSADPGANTAVLMGYTAGKTMLLNYSGTYGNIVGNIFYANAGVRSTTYTHLSGTSAARFPYGIRLQEMSAPSTPPSGHVYIWSNSGSDDDLTATYDNGKNNIFSTKPN